MKRWISILLTTLLVTVLTAAGYAYEIDRVCQGAERTYRIDGEVNSSWAWTLVNALGDPVDNSHYSFQDFTDIKDGEPIQGSEISILWDLPPGTYTLSAEQTSIHGCENYELGTIEVLPIPEINAGPDLVSCAAQPVTLSDASASNHSSILWTTSGDGTFDDATLLHPVYTPGAADIVAGTVTLELTANGLASNGTCEPVSDDVIIQISNLTVTLAADATEACLGSTVSLEATVSGGIGVITHLWTGTGSEYLSDVSIANPVFSGAPAGVYILTYTAKDAVDCEVTEDITITILENPLADITANATEVCEGNTIQLNGNPSGGSGTFTKHEWTSANADNLALLTALDIQNPVFISSAIPGTYTYIYTVTDDNGCIASDEITLTVHPLPTVAVTATPAEVCQGTPIQLQGTPSGGSGTFVTHLWTADAGVVDWIDDRSIQNPVFSGDATPGTYTLTYTVTDNKGCEGSGTVEVTINGNNTPIFTQAGPYCEGTAIAELPTTSENGITGTWAPTIDNTQTTIYTFTPDAGQCATTATMTITIDDQITPIFAQVGPYCEGVTIDALPTVSENGITGTWAPAIDNTQTTIYTFTPDAGQCATTATMTITIDDQITPVFAQVGPYCEGTAIAELPTTSENGITGTWAPAIDNTQTTTYTFTPDAGLCATTATMTITIDDQITPVFAQVGPYCEGTAIAELPTTSENGITGTWAPAIDNTQTTIYTFTPDAGQCATTATMTITIDDQITPVFAQVGPYCEGSTIAELPTTSENGITGTWAPAIDNTQTTTYTFTPDPDQCGVPVTMTIEIEDEITPIFTQVGPFCTGTTIADLPTISENGITGTWAPAIDNTQTTIYTFTPDAGQCATTATMTITIDDQITPVFAQVGPYCEGTAIAELPTTSENGITGTWAPAIDNTQTTTYTFTPDPDQCGVPVTMTIEIEDEITPIFAQVGPFCTGTTIADLPTTSENGITGTWAPAIDNTQTTTYTFTPDPDQCGVPVTMIIEIEDEITPIFTQVGPFCTGTAIADLPTTSENGITGTWAPAIDNTQTTTYTFTPDPDQCGVPVTMIIEIEDEITPIFTQVGPFCTGTTIADLPTTSENGITGTWAPAIDNTQTTTYTFTPDPDQCGVPVTMTIEIEDEITPIFTQVGPFCTGTTIADLPTTSENGITGTWAPAIDNTLTTTYTFTPDGGQCATTAIMTITINEEIIPVFAQVGPYCEGATIPELMTTSENLITGTWSPAIDNTQTTTYTFTPDAGQCATTATMTITIDNLVQPVFDPIADLCVEDTPPTLPTTDKNGIPGTWTPGSIDTSSPGIFRFVFEPDATVACPVNDTLFVTVTNTLRPRLAEIGPLCRESEAPLLPASDEDGITGTWSPAIIDTKVAGTFTYEFTPDAGYTCAVPGSITITIEDKPFLEANDPAPVCEPSVIDLTAGEILVGDKTGLNYSYWQDAETTIEITKPDSIWYSGIYFIKATNPAGCDTTLAINVVINPIPELIVNSPEAVCEPLTVDLADDRIVAGSDPGLIYTYWADSAMTIAIDDPNNIAVGGRYYICAENAGNCRIVKGVDVTIHRSVTTDFAQIGPFCQDEIAPSLPDIDLNGVPGTWLPDTIITTTPGAFEFVFTPDPTLECAVPDTILVTVNPVILPEFDPIDPICQDVTAPDLPLADKNGITGTWAPTAIATDIAGTFTFVFTPAAGQGCVLNDTIEVVVNPTIVPEFDPLAALCQGTTAPILPTTDKNGITGTWVPSLIDTQTAGTFEFVFTPDAGQGCTINDTLAITITPAIIPEFDLADNFCIGAVPPDLPLTDKNNVAGTWSPSAISTAIAGTITYTFTPSGTECAQPLEIAITVHENPDPVVEAIQPDCNIRLGSIVVTSATAGLEFSLDGGAFASYPAGGFTDLAAGTYILTTRNANLCEVSETVEILAAPEIPAVPVLAEVPANCDETTRAFDVVSPAGTEYEYSIDGTTWQASRNFGGLAPATYTLRVRNVDGCESNSSITLNPAPAAPAEPELTAVAPTCDVPTGSISVTSPTGSGLEYSIDGTTWQTDPLFENLTPGDYAVRVRNSALCESSATVTINQVPDMPDTPVADITQPNCDIITGTLTVKSPLSADLEYSIDDTNWQTDPEFAGLVPGTYTLWVRNAAGCRSSETFEIIPSTGISLADVVVSHVLCYGETNGFITLTAITGPNPVISWTGPNGYTASTLDISGLAAGNYALNITDDNLCVKDTLIEIRQPDAPVNAIALPTNVTRPYANDGTITLDISGGTPGYNISWTGPDGFTATTQIITGLAPGVYTATISDKNGCPFNLPPITITQPDGTVTLPEPAPMVLCPTAPLPAAILTYPEYITAIGAGTTDCPEGFDESTFKLVSEVSDGLKCPETIVRTYQIEDECGMTATVEHVFIKNDNVRPNFNFSFPIEVECQAEVRGYPTFRTLDEFINAGGFASDNCAINPATFKYIGDSPLEGTECDGMIRRRYTVEDYCGNMATAEVQFRILDESGPRVRNYKRTLTSECSAPAPYRNINDFRADGGVADDNDCGNITLKLVKTDTISRSCPMELVRTYELTDRCGNTSTFEQTIIVDDNTAPVFAAIPEFLGECEPGMEAKINQWLRDVTATDNCKVKSITHDFDLANLPADCCGDLIVNFVAVDECDNSATATATIRLKARVSVDIDPIIALACAGSSVTFTAEPHNGGTNPKFQWYRNGTAVAGATGITYTIANPQQGDRVYVRLTSDIVCTDVKEADSPIATVSITNILTPTVSIAPLDPDICEGEQVTFTATPVHGGTNPAYQWLVNGQPVTGATGVTFIYAPKDKDQITVRMTSDLVCVDTQTVTSAPATAKVTPNLVVTVDLSANRDTVCAGDPITLKAEYENGGTNPLFTWFVNNNAVPGNNTDTYTFIPDKGDVVRVSLTSSERCVADRTVSSGIHTIDVLVIDPVAINCPPDVTFECLGDEPPITDIQVMIDRGYIINAHHVDRRTFTHTDVISKTPQGTVILRTYTVQDLCGGEASCTQRITVSDDEPPVAVPRDVTVYLDETGIYTVDRDDILESASDNCTPFDKLVIRAIPPTVDCSNVGDVILVQIIVTDEAGNESVPVYANITVLDQMPPEALCRDITVYLDENGRASITPADIDNGSTDNCQIVSRTLDRSSFDCNSVGPNPVKLTVVDASGNIDVCDAIVTVKDTIAPVAICQSVDIQIGPNGQVRLSPTMVDGGSFDNCGVPSLRIEPEFLTCENVGENIVTLYVTDRYGNVSTCQTIVNVLGNTPPIARDDNVKALMNQNTMILILMNDTDAEGDLDPKTVWIMTPPEHGSLSVNASGTVTYKPFDNYLGPDTFTYRVCDNGIPCFEMCDTAVVTITVVEDNLAPIARDDEYDAGCLAISGNILTNDIDPDGDNIFLSPYLILPPANGEIELNPNGSFLYVSKSGYVGLDSLIYQICDDGYPSKCDTATVTFNIFKDEDCDGKPDEGPLTFFIPEGFSPNGDGVHDFFQILGIEDYPDAKLYIFNRWGSKLFEKEHYGNLTYWGSPEEAWWWGYSEASLTLGGGKVPVGNYIYILELGNGTTHTGTVMVSY